MRQQKNISKIDLSMAQVEDDFDPKGAIAKLSANFEQPDKFAEIFCTAAKTQKIIDNTLKETVRSLIQHDNETRKSIKEQLREIEAEEWRFYLRKGGAAILVFISLATGAILTGISRHFFP